MWPGRSSPLGATPDDAGVNFAIFSDHATRIDLCLFDSPDSAVETDRITLPERTDQVWHGYLPGAKPGQIYGYRVYGPRERGHAFDPSKLLLDPYARAIAREFVWNESVLLPGSDTAGCAALARVVKTEFPWEGDH